MQLQRYRYRERSTHVPERFSVRDAATASWLVRRINEARAYAKRVSEWAQRELKRAERDEEFLMRRFGSELQEWASKEIERLASV